MQTEWAGHYLDGRSAARQRATVRVLRGGLEISTETGATLWWPYREIRQTQGFYDGEEVRLERGGEIAEALQIPDMAFLAALHRAAPEAAPQFHDPSCHRQRLKWTLLAALGAVGISAALYLWGIPSLATVAASRVPVSWEERLGRAVITHLAPPERQCGDPTREWAIREILATLMAPLPKPAYTFRVMVVNSTAVNALAAPGGYVVLFRGLVERTRSAEELAGVLAHELQHILHRHATRAILEQASTGLLMAALTGDVGGTMAYGLEGARLLAVLKYSRQNEEEADVEGMRMLLAAGINAEGMIAFLEGLQKTATKAPILPQYLSTHPSTEKRIQRLRLLASQTGSQWTKLLPDYDWRDLRNICPARRRQP
jgi:predicted Zn-dependent protease